MINRIFSLVIATVLFVSLISCNDKPSDLAINLLPDTVAVSFLSSLDTMIITGKSVYSPKLPIFNNGSVFIGKFEDMEAISLINFAYLPDTLGNITVDLIESAELTLYPDRYAYGDTLGGSFGFDIYQVIRRWTPESTTYDSVMVSPANYFSTQKIGQWEGNIQLADTIDPIKIELPHDLIIEWLKTETVFDSTSQSMVPKRIPNWGLAFIPKPNTNVIHRFEAAAPAKLLSSTVVVKYKDAQADTTKYLNLVSGIDVSYLKSSIPDTEKVVIQNGLNYWTKFDFDITMIPKYSGFHKVQFELTLDPENSRAGNVPLDSVIEMGYYIDEQKSNFFNYTGFRQAGTNKYIFPSLTSIFQYINKFSGKFTLELTPYAIENQSRELERLTFFGLDEPDESKRPTLKIIYSLNPAYLEPGK
ncbi:MAG: hypothetical protein KIT33_12205 [Candidatus Kapabacteria bacterium]|nr:hypothetical protein [Ignavibacteriota bacterium]MCW5885723.1 hypothetical protein [Candidatus Kapabacteria bacterium]